MRISRLSAACLWLLAVTACSDAGPQNDAGGSYPIAGVTASSSGQREITFAGALNGTSETVHQACDTTASGSGRAYTMTATGDLSGLTYFLSLTIYPYDGPHAYVLRNTATDPMYLPSTPRVAPGYPGFLNFLPKYHPGNAFGPDTRGAGRPLMAVEATEQSGWFDVEMVSLNAKGQPARLAIKGRFACGPAFEI